MLSANKTHSHYAGRDLLEPFQLPFVQRGLIEVLILAVPAGLLGTWIVLRGLAFFSHAVGTAAFPGLVLADGLGFAPPLGAFAAAAAFSAGNSRARPRRGEGGDSVVAIVLVGCLAAGVILASDVFGSGANVETLLFGSLLLVDGGDIALAAVAAAATLLASLLVGHRWLQRGFDAAAPGSSGPRRGAARRPPARPDRAGDDRGALGGRRPARRRPLRRPGDHRPPPDPADAELAAGERRPGRRRGHGRALALGQDRRAAGGDDRLRLRRGLRARRRGRGPRSPLAAGPRRPRRDARPRSARRRLRGARARPPAAGSRWWRRRP